MAVSVASQAYKVNGRDNLLVTVNRGLTEA